MTKKLREFLKSDINDCKTSDIPGIGPKTNNQLMAAKFKKASQLYDIYKDSETYVSFNRTMMGTYKVSLPESTYNALDSYHMQCTTPKKNSNTLRQNPRTTITRKGKMFLEEPMENKTIDSIPGIGKVTAKSLKEDNITKAYHLFGKYLLFDKNKDAFTTYMKNYSPSARFIDEIFDVFTLKANML